MTPTPSSSDFCNLNVPASRSGTPDLSPDQTTDRALPTTPSSLSGDAKHRVTFHLPPGVKQRQAPASAALATERKDRASSAPGSEPLAKRQTQILPADSATRKDQRSANEALSVIDEAHRRLKHQVDARAGRAYFAQPGRVDPIDPEAPDLLARLTRLRREIHNTVRLVEQSGTWRGMLGAQERQTAIRRLQDQAERLGLAFHLWNNGLPLSVDPGGATLREDTAPAGGRVGHLDWATVHACCKVLAEPGSQSAAPGPGVLYRLLKGRLRVLEKSLVHHPLYMPRLLATKARYWEAAARTLEALRGPRDLASRSVQAVAREPSMSQEDGLDHKHATGAHTPGILSQEDGWDHKHATGMHTPRSKKMAPAPAKAAPAPMDGDPIATAVRRFRWYHDKLASEARADSNKNKLGEPEAVLGLGGKHLLADWFGLGRDAEIREARIEWALRGEGFPDNGHMSEEAFALACVKRVVAEARAAAKADAASRNPPPARHWWSRRKAAEAGEAHPFAKLTDKEIEKEFDRICSRLRSEQDNPVIHSTVVVPILKQKVEGGAAPADTKAPPSSRLADRQATEPYVLHFEQRPASAVSDALHESFVKDGVQGAHCHERTQHKHAVNLFVSRMKGRDGRCGLTLTRHGVLSPNQLVSKGIRSLSDADLYRVAVDLADTLNAPPFHDPRLAHALRNNADDDHSPGAVPGTPTPAKMRRIANLVRGRAEARTDALLPEAEGLRAAALWEDDPRVADRESPRLPPLIDMIRRAASLNRAKEAAQAALCSLSDDELIRLLPATAAESKYSSGDLAPVAPVTVRLASVSLMTPDVVRAKLGSYKDDELTMWQDQAQAWADLEALGPLELPMPRRGADGRLLRDAAGRLLTSSDGTAPAWRVRFDVAAMNVPVNEWGTKGRVVGVMSRAHARADAADRLAMLKLLGATPEAWAACRPDMPGTQPELRADSWLDRHLRSGEVTEKEKRILRTLAAQIGSIYASNAHMSSDGDPYKLATRLIVLASRLDDSSAVLVNCKSGKDRTSVAETEARQMTLEIATTGQVPAVGAPVTELRSIQLGALHDAGGSPHVQAWNTGMGGTKADQKALFLRFGLRTKDRVMSFLGLSTYTKS